MSYPTIGRSTKRRRFLEEIEMIELTDQNEPEISAPQNVSTCSNISGDGFPNVYNEFNVPSTPNIIVNDVSDIQSNNIKMLNDEYEAFSSSSNSDIEDELRNVENISIVDRTDSSILNNLAKWAVLYNIPHIVLSALLGIFKMHSCHSYFPVDARTILKINKSSIQPLQIQTVSPGSFYYFKIKNDLKHIYNMDNQYFVEDEIKIVLGIDGLPLTKSSSSCF